jgi:O-antigen ligase
MKRNDWIYLSYFLPACLLPVGNAPLTWSLIIVGICWLINSEWKEKLIYIRSNRWYIFFVLFYAITAAGVFYSDNKGEAYFKLEQKIAILIVPLIFLSVPVASIKLFRLLMNAFIFSCLIVVATDEIMALIQYYASHDYGSLLYLNFTGSMHPTYLSFILNIAVAYCLERILSLKTKSPFLFFYYPALLLLLLAIIQASSKAGIFSLPIVVLCVIVNQIRKKEYPGFKTVLSLLMVSVLFLLTIFMLNHRERISNMVHVIEKENLFAEKTSTESNQLRLLVWQSGLELVKQRPIAGYGTGDGNNALEKQNLKNGYTTAYERSLNAHSQYLQIMLANGLIGLVLFMAAIFMLIYKSFKENNYMGYCFILLITFNMLFESMLETRNGIAIFSFFSGLLFCYIGDRNPAKDSGTEKAIS